MCIRDSGEAAPTDTRVRCQNKTPAACRRGGCADRFPGNGQIGAGAHTRRAEHPASFGRAEKGIGRFSAAMEESAKRLDALHACLLYTSYSTLAEAADISEPTAKEWLRLLQGLGIVYLLQPYANNALKRLSKTPKLYFCDTGLCAFLSMWLTADALEAGAASGHFYENYVVMELVRNYAYSRSKANLTFYRDSNAKEIDVFIEENNQIHPLEIKKSAAPNYRTVKNYTVLDKAALNRGMGGIICMADAPIPICLLYTSS